MHTCTYTDAQTQLPHMITHTHSLAYTMPKILRKKPSSGVYIILPMVGAVFFPSPSTVFKAKYQDKSDGDL